LGDVKLEDLPGPEALLRPGTKYNVQHCSKTQLSCRLKHKREIQYTQWQRAGETILDGKLWQMKIPSRRGGNVSDT